MNSAFLTSRKCAIAVDCLDWLAEVSSPDRHVIGERAWYLSHLAQQGCSVLPGFVIPATVRQSFLDAIQWAEPLLADLPSSSLHLDLNAHAQLQAISQGVQDAILATELPRQYLDALADAIQQLGASAVVLQPSLALPASDSLGLSQQLENVLDCQFCWAKREDFATALKATWAEIFRAKALFCLQRFGIQPQQVTFAVLVHPLQPVLASGYLHYHEDRLEVQATWGLSVAIERGDVIPDRYSLRRAMHGIEKTQSLSSKILAYQVADPSQRDRTEHSPFPEPCLRTVRLSEAQQQDSVIDAEQLTRLEQLAETVATCFNGASLGVPTEPQSGLTLQWVLGESAVDLYLTQAMPQLPHSQTVPPLLPNAAEPTAIQPPKTLASPVPSSRADSPERQLVAQGFAASSGYVQAKARVIRNPQVDITDASHGYILVAANIQPDWLPWVRDVAGIVVEQGGMTCHAAIIARELGIPAVVGALDATRAIATGDWLQLDGNRGTIHRNRSPIDRDHTDTQATDAQATDTQATDAQATNAQAIERPQPPTESDESALTHPPVAASADSPAPFAPRNRLPESLDGELALQPLATQLLVNASQPDSIEQVSQLPVDGIGLLRAEWLLPSLFGPQQPEQWLQRHAPEPFIAQLAQSLNRFVRAFAPRPVFYRSLDWQTVAGPSAPGQSVKALAANSLLGVRGTFRYQLDPALFDRELAALAQLRQAGADNLHLMLPFVRSVEEFVFCRDRIQQAGLLTQPDFQLWIAAEVPSVLFLLPEYVQAGVQGISIGSNDLTQLILGVDRDRADIASGLNARHPAVQRAIAQLIQSAKELGIPCSICGQAPVQFPELIEHLIQWGIQAISVEAAAVETTYLAIARAERKLLLQNASQQPTHPQRDP